MAETDDVVMVATRVSKQTHAKILKRQREVRRLTGITPSVSAVVRAMIEEAPVEQPRTKSSRRSAAAA